MSKRFALVLLILASCFVIEAQTTYSVSFSPTSYTGTINASSNTSSPAITVTVTRSATPNTTLNFYLLVESVSPGTSTLPGERRAFLSNDVKLDSIRYRIALTTTATSEISSLPTVSGAIRISGQIARRQASISKTFYITIPKGIAPSGQYTSTFKFALFIDSQTPPAGTQTPITGGFFNVTINGNSSETFSVTLTPSTTLYLGYIDPSAGMPENDSTILSVIAPQYYSLAVRSGNNGYLVLDSSPDQKILYRFKFGKKTVGPMNEFNLTNGLQKLVVLSPTQATELIPHEYTIAISIDPIDLGSTFLEGGLYKDDLYFTFTTP